MTNGNSDTLKLENVPMPSDFRMKREYLPANITETLKQMRVGQSFFLVTESDEHTVRKSAALRSRVVRLQNDHPDLKFSIRRETNDAGETGVRVYRVESSDADQ